MKNKTPSNGTPIIAVKTAMSRRDKVRTPRRRRFRVAGEEPSVRFAETISS